MKKFFSEFELKSYLSFFIILIIMFVYTLDYFIEKKIKSDIPHCYYAGKIYKAKGDLYNYENYLALADKNIVVQPYIYPPFPAMIFSLLTFLPIGTYQLIIYMISILSLTIALRLTIMMIKSDIKANYINPLHLSPDIQSHLIVLSAAFIFSIRNIFWGGNIDMVIFLLIVSSLYLSLRKKDLLSGVLISIAFLIKLLPVFLLLYFIVKKRYNILLGFIIGTISLILISFFYGGIKNWIDFFNFYTNQSLNVNYGLITEIALFHNLSIFAFFRRLDIGSMELTYIITYLTFGFLTVLTIYLQKDDLRNNNSHRFSLPFLILMILCVPVTWGNYFLFILPGFCFFISTVWHEQLDKRLISILIPYVLMLVHRSHYTQLCFKVLHSIYEYPLLTSLSLYSILLLYIYFFLFNKKIGWMFNQKN